MKHKTLLISSILAGTLMVAACDDSTDNLGSEMMPSVDMVTQTKTSYDVYTQSYSAGNSVLARSSKSYLGQFTDPETGTIVRSDFLTQFHCLESFEFPEFVTNDSITSTDVRLYLTKFVGDSLATFKLSVYPLTKVMDPDADYYTDIDPEQYYDPTSEPLTVKWFTLSDRTVDDDVRSKSSYYNNINIPLPASIGQEIYNAYKQNPDIFRNSEAWINSGLPGSKGFYFKLESGDGAMAYIDIAQFSIRFRFRESAEAERDTTGACQFAATEEVIQATRFTNSNLDSLLLDNSATYLKSPAGIFTMATLPADQLNYNDTINTASITFTRYNDLTTNAFKLDIPKYVLLVRLDDYKRGFFEHYKLTDSHTSYLASFNAATNTYTFSNISHLLNIMVKEKHDGTATPDYNKVLLIPVEPTFDQKGASSVSSLVKLTHDFSMSSARLVGGKDPLKLDVIYSRFRK